MSTRQAKLRFVTADGEATLGTYVTMSANSLKLPAVDVGTPTVRGSGLISRTSTMDGLPGDITSVPGSYAWDYNLQLEMGIPAYDSGGGVPAYDAPGYLELLRMAGFESFSDSDADGDFFAYRPSILPFAAYVATPPGSDTVRPPSTFSLNVVQNNNGTSDWAFRMRSATAVASMDLTAGAIATITFATKALVVDESDINQELLYTTDADISRLASGNYAQFQPLMVLGLRFVLTGLDTSSQITVIDLQSVRVSTNSTHPDLLEAQAKNGFAYSPVHHNTSPTVSFNFADSNAVDDVIFAAMRSGRRFSIEADLVSPLSSDRFIRISIPSCQLPTVAIATTDSSVMYEVDAIATRPPASPSSPGQPVIEIKYYYAGP